jgi:hypothetical protein
LKIDAELKWLVIISLAALVIRLGVSARFRNRLTPGEPVSAGKYEVEYLRDPYMELGDSQQYLLLAENLRQHRRFSWDGAPVTFRLPGYPLLIALLGNRVGLLVVVQSLLSALSVLLVGLAAKGVYGRVAGLVSAGLMMIDIPNILHCGMVMSESLFVVLVSGALVALVFRREWLGGLFLGMAALTRPIAIFTFVPVALFLSVRSGRSWFRVIVFLVGFGLLPGAWVLRNYRLFHRFGFSSNGGYNIFYAGAAELVAAEMGVGLDSARAVLVQRYQAELSGNNPLMVSERMARTGLGIIMREPVRFARIYLQSVLRIVFGIKADDLVLRMTEPGVRLARVGEVWAGGDGSAGMRRRVIFILSAVELLSLMLAIGLAVLAFFWKDKRAWWWLLAVMALYFVLLAAPLSDGRFRVPAVVFIYVLAGGGARWWLFRKKEARA